jgi:hypothetical protein
MLLAILMAASLTWRGGLQRSKTATDARHRQQHKEIGPKRCQSPPFRIDGFVEPIKVSQPGQVSLTAHATGLIAKTG